MFDIDKWIERHPIRKPICIAQINVFIYLHDFIMSLLKSHH